MLRRKALAAHAELFHHTGGGLVALVAACDDALESEISETCMDKGAGGLKGQSLSPEIRLQQIPDFGGAIVRVRQLEPHRPDQTRFCAPPLDLFRQDREIEIDTIPVLLVIEKGADRLLALGKRIRSPDEELRHLGQGRIGMERLEIARGELPNNEARRFDGERDRGGLYPLAQSHFPKAFIAALAGRESRR